MTRRCTTHMHFSEKGLVFVLCCSGWRQPSKGELCPSAAAPGSASALVWGWQMEQVGIREAPHLSSRPDGVPCSESGLLLRTRLEGHKCRSVRLWFTSWSQRGASLCRVEPRCILCEARMVLRSVRARVGWCSESWGARPGGCNGSWPRKGRDSSSSRASWVGKRESPVGKI